LATPRKRFTGSARTSRRQGSHRKLTMSGMIERSSIFLTDQKDRANYVRNVALAVKPGGYVIVSTFGPEGPVKCSGLDVVRYDAKSLHEEFGIRFQLVDSSKELHHTPFGTTQQFLYCFCTLEV
jgi:hypothetical protein